MSIRVEHIVNAPREEVWDAIADLSDHASWMKDARGVEFLGAERRGVGTRIRVPTQVGPLRTVDIIEVTEWSEGESIRVRHDGIVSGVGEFRLESTSPTTIIWEEDLSFPWWAGGAITAWFARPILRWVWAGNLRRFGEKFPPG